MPQSRALLRPGGEFRFATDIADYAAWTLVRLLRSREFAWTAERADDWRQPWAGFSGTRYEAKAKRAGRMPCYLIFNAKLKARYGIIVVRLPHLPEAHHALGGRRRQLLEIGKGCVERLAGRALAARPGDDDRARRRPAVAGRFAEDEDRVGPVAAHQPVGSLDRHAAQQRQRGHRLLELLVLGEIGKLALAELASLMQFEQGAACRRVIARRRALAELTRNLVQHALDFGPGFGLGLRQQALLHHRGRTHQQVAEQVRRDIGARADFSARSPSPSERLTNAEKPPSDRRAD